MRWFFALFRTSPHSRIDKALTLFEQARSAIATAIEHAKADVVAIQEEIAALADKKADAYNAVTRGERALRGLSRMLNGGE